MAYVTPFLATTNAVISSADCNAGYRGNIMRLREMLPDPGAAGRLLRSLGSGSAATADWVEDGAGSEIDADLLDGQQGSYYATASGLAALEASAFPSGVGAWVRNASEIPSGFTRESALDGRIPVGAGTTFAVTFVEATNYGSSWSHTHTIAHSHTDSGHTHNMGASDDNQSIVDSGTGTNLARDIHEHAISNSSAIISGSDTANSGGTAWTIPSRAVVWIRKS